MENFTVNDLLQQQATSEQLYLEFLRHPALSMGLYTLPAGGADPQQPHTEDEVYYVVSGRAKLRVADETQAVAAGSIVYVPKNVEHRFVEIEETLVVLVFFAPAEGSLRAE